MSSATLTAEPVATATEHADVDRPSAGHLLWRAITGLALIMSVAASIAAMVVVTHDRVGFSPVLSPSMQPAFGPGDLIVTRSEPASAMRVGQIVALPIPGSQGQKYVHRLISVRHEHGLPVVRTKGDANPAPEPYDIHVTSATVPVVIAAVPDLGRLSVLTARSTPRLILLALTVGFMIVAARRLAHGFLDRDRSATP